MSRRVRIVLLCEDVQQRTFLLRFLRKMRRDFHSVRVEMAPRGEGSAVQFVRNRFPDEVAEHRRSSVSNVLMVMVDGDDRGVERRIAELDAECERKKCRVRTSKEPILVLVPTWRIETWLAYLDGESVDESKDDYSRLPRERECEPHVEALVDMCRQNRLREPAPPSLAAACAEYRRWSDAR